MEKLVRILVADDHDIVRKGVIHIVRDVFPAAVIDEAGDGEETLQKCLTESWHLLILDISMPKLGGLEVLRQAKLQRPELCVIIFSMHMWPQHVQLAVKLGASGYVGKTDVVDELRPAVQAVLNGETYFSREVTSRLQRNVLSET
jgi:DNA-binding NarL/FixJ family response regulator